MRGINVAAPVNGLGYGVVGFNLLREFSSRVRTSWWPIGPAEASPEETSLLNPLVANAQLFDADSPSLRVWHQFDMAQHVGKGLRAGLPIFELDGFNGVERHHLRSLDVVFAPTAWAREVLVCQGLPAERLRRTCFGVDTTIFRNYPEDDFSKELKTALGTGPETTVFLNVGKWEVRKGHDFLGDAFSEAFSPSDDVLLVMCCANPFLSSDESNDWASYYKGLPMGNKTVVLKDRLPTQKRLARLMGVADVGVFPSRAEGWNLDLAEMMSMGKRVIATDCSAHSEFCTPDNCRLIETKSREPAFDGRWFHGQGRWATLGEFQREQLVEHMRAVHREGKGKINDSGRQTFLQHFTWAKGAEAILDGLYNTAS